MGGLKNTILTKLQHNGFNHTLEKGNNLSRLSQRQLTFLLESKVAPHKDQYWLEFSISSIQMISQTAVEKLKM